jgi:uncharacterized DUF497 family protein
MGCRFELRETRRQLCGGQTVFSDPFEAMISDPVRSAAEMRFASIGLSETGRLLVVVYAERLGRTRIIAREATPKERRQYESRPS